MINYLKIYHYRKLKNMSFKFTKGINIISGSNGTCKSSLLYLISNSFQYVKLNAPWMADKNCIRLIKKINQSLNPKIESLTKGDKQYNNPAEGTKGHLYGIGLSNGKEINFRRHNSAKDASPRYSLKPYYSSKAPKVSLEEVPIIYLGLPRLFPYGEFSYEDNLKVIRGSNFPAQYIDTIRDLYKDFTGYDIQYDGLQDMGGIKKRAIFDTKTQGVDSNTMSAGEDNLLIIIVALVSLKYYYDSVENSDDSIQHKESILLIDEIDSTLHPAFQLKLLNLIEQYAIKYEIQVFFTTHSFSILEESFNKKINIIYLKNDYNNITLMDNPNYLKIKMDLIQKLHRDLVTTRKIPIFSEDEEARVFINELFDYYHNTDTNGFAKVRSYFHLVNANVGCENLKSIFNDPVISGGMRQFICILDGDQTIVGTEKKYIVLPGKNNPEQIVFSHLDELIKSEDNNFWLQSDIESAGYSRQYCYDNIIKIYEANEKELETTKDSTKGKRRDFNKKIFNTYLDLFTRVIRHWIMDNRNKNEIENFFKEMHIQYKKTCEFYHIDKDLWASI